MKNPDVYCSQVQPGVTVIESVLVPPSRHSPKSILYLSNLDDHFLVRRRFEELLIYCNIYSATNPARVIRDALSQLLSYYYPHEGRLRGTQDGRKLQVDCTGEGALFVEAATDSTLPIPGEFEELKSWFEQLIFHFPITADFDEVPPLIFQVTRFHCGGFVVGVSFNHSLCDTCLTDRRWLGFNQVDFGWGDPIIACLGNWLRAVICPIAFVLPPKAKSGVTMVFCVPRPAWEALETELHAVM